MSLATGARLGNYEILGPLGKGGMGEVYRAKDTKLDREVAVKVLPAEFALHQESLARFEREAKVLAALNHPNIATIYGVEESDGGRALAMELVKGEALRGPLPLETAFPYAKQIADALEAAHEQGIVHRDLKPANIMVTLDGVVKVLDFGLAAVVQPNTTRASDPRNSPTITMAATQAGMIMGTAAYMSPEQASGKPVDKRADIWSYGVVLYEMLVGKQLFEGETISHILADVLRAPVDLDKLPANTPRVIRDLVKRCLDRDVKKRLRDIGEARVAIQNYLANPVDEAPQVAPPVVTRTSKLPWALTAVLALALAAIAFWITRPAPPLRVTRFEINAPEGSTLPLGTPAPSPDGQSIAYTVTGADGVSRIHIRSMDSTESHVLPGTDGAVHPFWSPDGRSLGFADETLRVVKRIDLAGGTARKLADVNGPWQGSWSQSGILLLRMADGIGQIPAAGGKVQLLPRTNDLKYGLHGFPEFLSDGKRYLSTTPTQGVSRDIALAALGSTQQTIVLRDVESAPVFAPTPTGKSYLLYLRDTALLAREFEERSGTVEGEEVLVVDNIGTVASPTPRPTVGVSSAGILAYQSGEKTDWRNLTWVDRAGKQLSQLAPTLSGAGPVLSPDGRFLAVTKGSHPRNIWLTELARGVSTRFTFSSTAVEEMPVWSPDSKRIAFRSLDGLSEGIYWKDSGGTGQAEVLLDGPWAPVSWFPDGQKILIKDRLSALFLLPLSGEKKPVPLGGSTCVRGGDVSPDGKFVACASSESGRYEVYVLAVPPGVGKWQISINGGYSPRWRRDGKELFFFSNGLMAVDVKLDTTVNVGVPHRLMAATPGLSGYDVTADGQRFLISSRPSATENYPITVVMNWWADLKK